MEGIGEKFRQARVARNLTLDEAARMTKIRPAKLAEIEAEDFSHFPSLAYAKGFLLIYGKFLNIDVSPYLEAFESSKTVTVDGYSYLQDPPVPKPRRSEALPRREPGNKSPLLPLVIGIVVLVAGFSILKLVMDIKRIGPGDRDAQALAAASATPSPMPSVSSGPIFAPKALPVDSTATPADFAIARAPTPIPMTTPVDSMPAPVLATPPPSIAPVAVAPPAMGSEPEVRRAERVHPEDLARAQAASVSPSASPAANRFDIRPLRKTYLRVTVEGGRPVERWLDASEAPLQFSGRRIAVRVLDPAAVEIRKNGKVIAPGDADVRIE